MKLGKLLLVAASLLLISHQVQSQDIHFSQYYASPLNLNPAITGVMTCDMRVSAIYRNQWGSVLKSKAFNTFSAGVEGKFAVGRNDYYGLGLVLWADKAGSSSFSTVQGQISASYLKRLGGRRSNEQYLVAGGQIGFTQRSISTLGLQWGTQWDGDQYNGTLSTQENLANTRLTYADINTGLLWYTALHAKNKSNIYFGIAFSHLTKANVAFLRQGFEALYMKTTVHGGGELRAGRRLAFLPNFAYFRQGKSQQANFGTSIKFDFSKRSQSDQAFQIGLFSRVVSNADSTTSMDALIAVTRVRFGSSSIGLSYDINTSRLRSATRSFGALELSYVYTLCGMRSRMPGCPYF